MAKLYVLMGKSERQGYSLSPPSCRWGIEFKTGCALYDAPAARGRRGWAGLLFRGRGKDAGA